MEESRPFLVDSASLQDTPFAEVCCSLLAAYPEQIASPALIDLVLQGAEDGQEMLALNNL